VSELKPRLPGNRCERHLNPRSGAHSKVMVLPFAQSNEPSFRVNLASNYLSKYFVYLTQCCPLPSILIIVKPCLAEALPEVQTCSPSGPNTTKNSCRGFVVLIRIPPLDSSGTYPEGEQRPDPVNHIQAGSRFEPSM
jgi:hypothetical protein